MMNSIARLKGGMEELIGVLVEDVKMQIQNVLKIQLDVIVKISKLKILVQMNSEVAQIVRMVGVMSVSN